ncbi:MAG: hypothetical protein ACI8ZM_005704 [Crocinitomix sp.]|jgi:hypothetical protein
MKNKKRIMRDKRSALKDLINLSNIYGEIEKIEILLGIYQCSESSKRNRYEIVREFDAFRLNLSKVEQGLKELKELSIQWEQFE